MVGGVILTNELIFCPICKNELEYNEDFNYFKCRSCEGEFWPGPAEEDVTGIWYDEQRYKASIAKKGGSQSRGRKGRERKKNKPLVTERYRLEE